jgi:hypothetical protein
MGPGLSFQRDSQTKYDILPIVPTSHHRLIGRQVPAGPGQLYQRPGGEQDQVRQLQGQQAHQVSKKFIK